MVLVAGLKKLDGLGKGEKYNVACAVASVRTLERAARSFGRYILEKLVEYEELVESEMARVLICAIVVLWALERKMW